MTCRIVVVASGRAGILRVALSADPLIRTQVVSVVVDRPCDATSVADAHGIPVDRIFERDNQKFSDALLGHCERVSADYVVLFFNRLVVGQLVERYRFGIVNIHAAMLPAFRGLHAFSETVNSGVRFMGATIHFITEAVDDGPIILQSVFPLDPAADAAVLRHRQFEQMCKGFIQVCHWLDEGRLRPKDNGVEVLGARYDQADFCPALEAPAAQALSVPFSASRGSAGIGGGVDGAP